MTNLIPETPDDFLVEMGRRSLAYESRVAHSQPRLDSTPFRKGQEWRAYYQDALTVLGNVAAQILKQLPESFAKAQIDLVSCFADANHPELGRLLRNPKNIYLAELLGQALRNESQMEKLMKLFVELGK